MKKIILLLLLLLTGCATVKYDPIPEPSVVDIPVTVQKYEQAVTDQGVEAIIEVPASNEKTVIKIIPTNKSAYKKHLTNEPSIKVQSDNKDIIVEQPKRVVWKKWAIFLFLLFLAGLLILKLIYDALNNFSPWSFVKKLFQRG